MRYFDFSCSLLVFAETAFYFYRLEISEAYLMAHEVSFSNFYKSRSRILNPGSCSLAKSRIHHSITLIAKKSRKEIQEHAATVKRQSINASACVLFHSP